MTEVQKLQRELNLPATLNGTFQGTAQAFQPSLKGLGLLLLAAMLVIYLILGILYESFIHPLTILSGLPSAGVGALLTLVLFHQELNLYGFVGIIMLIGIVKKNAIMMIDFALDAQRAGQPAAEAIFQGCLLRFRPIMMTTMAALMATLPIAIGVGAGSRRPSLARPGRGRRPHPLAAADALHHAGHLPLPRRVPRARGARASRPETRRARRDEPDRFLNHRSSIAGPRRSALCAPTLFPSLRATARRRRDPSAFLFPKTSTRPVVNY